MSENNIFQYNCVLACADVPASLINGLSLEEHEPVDLDLARQQHKSYVEYLKNSGLELFLVEPDEKYPDCVFVEDTAVALKNKILITNPGALSRRGEVDSIRSKIQSIAKDLKLQIGEINNKEEAFIDGGDVMFTGREFIVGLSTRTNLKGAQELADFFNEVPVTTCDVIEGLHLKSVMSMFAPDVIVISETNVAKSIYQQLEKNSQFFQNYKFIHVADDAAANMLTFNNKIVTSQDYESVYSIIDEFKNHASKFSCPNGEFKKIDGCLTCRCVFFSKGI